MIMIIYEVNIKTQPEIFAAYYDWLLPHVKQMLQYAGFKTATLQQDETDECKITVSYQVATREDLENYLQHHAKTMRDDGINRFNDKFSISRRIFKVLEAF
ncbi:MAG: DUF4286 family protein [Pseudomonadota bacterium]